MSLHRQFKICTQYRIVCHHGEALLKKLKPLFSMHLPRPQLPVILSLLVVILVVCCVHQHRQLNQMTAITTRLQHSIHRQHDTLQEQENKIMLQQIKARDQSQEFMELTRRNQTMSAQVKQMSLETARLRALGKELRHLAHLNTPFTSPEPSQTVMTGMGGTSREPTPLLCLSVDLPSHGLDQEMDSLQKAIALNRQQLSLGIDNFNVLKNDLKINNDIRARTPAIQPAPGIVSCKFGKRISPFSNKPEFHTGIDIANRKGTPVVASARGTVIFARKKWLIGNLVVIDHGNGIVTKYGHLDKILVKKEDQVNRGDTIGLMGNTGKSTGPHVHYEVLVKGESQDPSRYFSTEMATTDASNSLKQKDKTQ
ncbi:peptidoglycan DD-metalloendopeptidase family protein [Desulfocicer niacini]